MKWVRLKGFFLLCVVCFYLCSVSSFAEVCYEDEAHSELMMIFDELESINKQQAKRIDELENTAEQQETQIDELEKDLAISEQETTEVLSSLDAAESSLQAERNANLFQVIAAGGIGFMAGYVVHWILEAIQTIREYRAARG